MKFSIATIMALAATVSAVPTFWPPFWGSFGGNGGVCAIPIALEMPLAY